MRDDIASLFARTLAVSNRDDEPEDEDEDMSQDTLLRMRRLFPVIRPRHIRLDNDHTLGTVSEQLDAITKSAALQGRSGTYTVGAQLDNECIYTREKEPSKGKELRESRRDDKERDMKDTVAKCQVVMRHVHL